jgi:hypothetical protein
MRSPARWVVCFGVVAGAVGFAAPSKAYIAHPWCTGGGGYAGALTCSFDSYQQCLANARTCIANPAVSPLPQAEQSPRPYGRR